MLYFTHHSIHKQNIYSTKRWQMTSGIIDENIVKIYQIRVYHKRADERIATLLITQTMIQHRGRAIISDRKRLGMCACSAEKE
jgi:hypothetical protein